MNEREIQILEYLKVYGCITNSEARKLTGAHRNTIVADFQQLTTQKLILSNGIGKGTSYRLLEAELFLPEQLDQHPLPPKFAQFFKPNRKKVFFVETFQQALDADFTFNAEIELIFQNSLGQITEKRKKLSIAERKRKKERLLIDLSWASSSIEGATYSLLETEALIKYNQTANGKGLDEATMIMNHKLALDFMLAVSPGSLSAELVLKLHQILIDNLHVQPDFRDGMIKINNSAFVPCSYPSQLKEILEAILIKVNATSSVLQKAAQLNLLIAYLQPFWDGNKRTSRMLGNLVLMQNCYIPISFSHTPKTEYIKAIIYFYETQNPAPFKHLLLKELNHSFLEYLA